MIRRAHPSDLSQIFEIHLKSVAAAGPVCGAAWTEDQFLAEMNVSQVWLAQDLDGKAHSFVFCRENGVAHEITQLATDPDYWRQGHMRSLLVKIAEELSSPFWLEVHEMNLPACRLYESFGFIKVGSRRRYYSDGGSAVLYSKN